MTPLISLAALRTFVEVARLRSFKDAAQSLGVTSGAVSQQVKIVERRLDVTLFERSSRDVRPTEHGLRLMGAIHMPFEQIREALEDFHSRKPPRNVVTIVTPSAFASHWLVPRIDQFSRQHPEIEVRIDTSDGRGLQREQFDIAIRYGNENLEGFEAQKLTTSKLIVVGSPKLLWQDSAVLQPLDCLKFPLLHDRDRLNWPAWFRANGLKTLPAATRKGLSFADDSLLITAAAASQGLALVRDIHAENFLLNGQLKVAVVTSMEPFYSYYLITPSRIAQRPHIQAFRDWVLRELARPPICEANKVNQPPGTLCIEASSLL